VPSPSSVKGARAEQLAAGKLEAEGFRILQRNVRTRHGELDLVAEEGKVLVFVEVRSTRTGEFGGPLVTVDGGKQRRVIRAAREYLARHPELAERPMRFDVVGVTYEPALEVQIVRAAFDLGGW
jgi:putative endonuclease